PHALILLHAPPPPRPYTTLVRSVPRPPPVDRTARRWRSPRTCPPPTWCGWRTTRRPTGRTCAARCHGPRRRKPGPGAGSTPGSRSEEHTSELQSRFELVCRLLLE